MEHKSRAYKIFHFPITKIIISILVLTSLVLIVQKASQIILKSVELGADIKSLIEGILISAVALAIYIYLFKFYEKRKIEELSLAHFWLNAVYGFFTGFIILSVTIWVMYIYKAYTIVAINPISFLLPALAMAISSAIFEELLFRGIIFRIIEGKLGSIWALLISSSVFGIAHLANENSSLFSAIAITVEAGILLGAAYIYSKNLWLPIFIHFAWNFSEGGIYGAIVSGNGLSKRLITCKISGPDLLTGGTFGPENSLQALILGLVTGLLFLWIAKKQQKIVQPYWKREQVLKSEY
jgi:uncharacterized protein